MENNISDLVQISRNKYNINLLETIEHKELFQNIRTNSIKSNSKKKFNNNEHNINNINNDIQSEKKTYNNQRNNHSLLSKGKNSSKSFKSMMKIKSNNMQGMFNEYSPEKNIKFLTQNNSNKINIKRRSKRNISTSLNKRIADNKALLDYNMNLQNFNFQRENNNLISEDYFSQSRNNDIKLNNFSYFNKNSKKEYNNNSKYSFNSNNNKNNLDVYNRLYNKTYYKKKNIENVISSDENNCTFNPNLLSKLKEKKPTNEEIKDFIERQEKFNKYIKQKKNNLKQDLYKNESKKCTFTPNTSCTSGSKYSIKLEAQRQDESKLDKTNRMVYEQIKKIEEKNNNLFLMYNNQFSFIPIINKNINIKRYKSPKNSNIPKYKKVDINSYKNENDIKLDRKYINHQYDNIKSNYKNDRELMARIQEENKRRRKRIDNMRKDQENTQFERYTFKPEINRNNLTYMNNFNFNLNSYFYNKSYENEKSYIENYRKKRNYSNKLNRSHSCYNKNNLNINRNSNFNDYKDYQGQIYNYNHTYYENNPFNFNEYNNNNKSFNKCRNNYLIEKDINHNNLDYYNEYNIYNNQYDEFCGYEKKYKNIGKRNLNIENYENNNNYMYITPESNKIYKSRAISSIKKEDKQNFLLIHKLLYN